MKGFSHFVPREENVLQQTPFIKPNHQHADLCSSQQGVILWLKWTYTFSYHLSPGDFPVEAGWGNVNPTEEDEELSVRSA